MLPFSLPVPAEPRANLPVRAFPFSLRSPRPCYSLVEGGTVAARQLFCYFSKKGPFGIHSVHLPLVSEVLLLNSGQKCRAFAVP